MRDVATKHKTVSMTTIKRNVARRQTASARFFESTFTSTKKRRARVCDGRKFFAHPEAAAASRARANVAGRKI